MKEQKADVGIITFHCSNNYGAMLQAYGLKRCLLENGVNAEIVRYEPPFMTGRHWWIPYAPVKGLKGRIWCMENMWNGFWDHMRRRKEFLGQRANMNRFRNEFLIKKGQPRYLTTLRFKQLPYRCYVLGSDQIWNPDITCGLRRAYFGAFASERKERAVSYAASFGGASLAEKYDKRFQKLLSFVDAVSVREEAAVSYVQKFCKGKVTAVLDPVFFLKREAWRKVEHAPCQERFIFLYLTEKNQEMAEYAKRLSAQKKLPVIEVRAGRAGTGMDFFVDRTAGPSEFLGYLSKAEYVVSNSFHAVAFSIIYEKRFLAFAHRNLGARVRNILEIHGLTDRLYRDETSSIDAPVDWEEVRRRTREAAAQSGSFLMDAVRRDR